MPFIAEGQLIIAHGQLHIYILLRSINNWSSSSSWQQAVVSLFAFQDHFLSLALENPCAKPNHFYTGDQKQQMGKKLPQI